ncbi:MAG: 4Fe-4S binding protein [Thermodesulfobacteriota bacterium]
MGLLEHGPPRGFVRLLLRTAWPVIIAGKRLSPVPLLKWLINPFFAYPYNEVTTIPINREVRGPENLLLPRRIVERLVLGVRDIFIMNECLCRHTAGCRTYPQDIGCLALGAAVNRLHPSLGRRATPEEAAAHVRRAAAAGLVASVAHTWIDPVGFGLTRFDKLMFVCFCDDCCCIFRTHLRKRGPNLDRAVKGLPGLATVVDPDKCDGCGLCAAKCFVAAMEIRDGLAVPGPACRGCGRCVELCPRGAARLVMEDEETLYRRLVERISQVADIWS